MISGAPGKPSLDYFPGGIDFRGYQYSTNDLGRLLQVAARGRNSLRIISQGITHQKSRLLAHHAKYLFCVGHPFRT